MSLGVTPEGGLSLVQGPGMVRVCLDGLASIGWGVCGTGTDSSDHAGVNAP